jgi:UDP-3-O-acyl N-acetylglucosamine deacetylase
MSKMRQQRTLRNSFRLRGFGYWTGEDVTIEFRPAPADHGIAFVRSDSHSNVRIPALVNYRCEAPRRTSLAVDNIRVEMVEHLLAALAGMRVDNCAIWTDRPELPCLDGSSMPVAESILEAGIVSLSAPRRRLTVDRVLRLGDDRSWVEARPSRSAGLHVEYVLDYGPGPIGRQMLAIDVNEFNFVHELAAARSFLLAEEAEQMRQQGIGARVTSHNLLVIGPDGPLDNELRFADECVRHKTLDLIGDLALAGCDLDGTVVAYRSGHKLNAELVAALLDTAKACDREKQIA